jgi:Leucine-rich repeat (LRR) protein
MKKAIFLRYVVLCFVFLGYQAKAQMYFIPDVKFRIFLQTNYASCMSATGDSLDGSCPAVINASSLSVSNRSIVSLTGLEAFQNLQILNCSYNQLSSLPTLPSSLTLLYCSQNQLTSLPSLPTSLTFLDCIQNQLTSLPALPSSLVVLYCNFNQLNSISALSSSLTTLQCYNNQLASLTFLPSTLTELYCYNNQLSSLPALPSSLITLDCSRNQLTSLPTLPSTLTTLHSYNNQLISLPALPTSLIELNCYSNQLANLPALPSSLISLQCSNNQLTSLPALPSSLTTLYCFNNINLNCLPDLKNVENLQITNTSIQCLPNYGKVTSCFPPLSSFPICGIYNTNNCEVAWNIDGNVYFDNDSNCVKAVTDSSISNQKIELYQNGSLVQQTYSNVDGNYYFDTDSLTIYSTSIDTTILPFSILCPINATYSDTLTTIDSLKSNRDFAAKCKGVDLGVTSIYGLAFRPAWISDVKIHAGDFSNNFGAHCATGVSATVQVNITGACQYYAPAFGALTPTSVIGNSLTYNIADFGTIDYSTAFGIQILVDTTAVLGSHICIDVVIQTLANDINHSNDTLTHCFTIVGSYDPNDKLVYPSNLDLLGSNWLTYTINFQNTGTADAIDILITDTLDAKLDWSTFELLSYSHFPLVQLYNTGLLKFNYPKIYLPDSTTNEPGSHGYVQFKIKAKNNLALSDTIKNTANIYFDFNAPIITNTTKNYATVTGINNIRNVNNFSVYPNPFREELSISRSENSKAILEIYNLLGEQILQREIQDKRTVLSTQTWPTGIYIVKLIGDKDVVTTRVVKN